MTHPIVELPLYLDGLLDEYDVDIEVHLSSGQVVTCSRVTNPPTLHRDWWDISHQRGSDHVSTMIPADKVTSFVVLTHARPDEDQPDG